MQTRATATREGLKGTQKTFLRNAAQQLAESVRAEAQRQVAEEKLRAQQARQQQLHESLGLMRVAKQARDAEEQARREEEMQAGLDEICVAFGLYIGLAQAHCPP